MSDAPLSPALKPRAEDDVVPATWPGAFGLYKHSRQAMMFNIGTYLSVFVLSLVIGIIPNSVDKNSPAYFLLNIATNIVAIWFEAAIIIIVLQSVKEHKISFNDSLQQGIAMFGKYFLQSLLLGLIAIGSLLCFIIPAFIILPRLSLAQYFLFDQKMGIVDSIKASWEATSGHVGKVWGIIGVNILMMLIMVTIIGIPISIYFLVMYSAANAILYFWLVKYGKSTIIKTPVAPTAPISQIQ